MVTADKNTVSTIGESPYSVDTLGEIEGGGHVQEGHKKPTQRIERVEVKASKKGQGTKVKKVCPFGVNPWTIENPRCPGQKTHWIERGPTAGTRRVVGA